MENSTYLFRGVDSPSSWSLSGCDAKVLLESWLPISSSEPDLSRYTVTSASHNNRNVTQQLCQKMSNAWGKYCIHTQTHELVQISPSRDMLLVLKKRSVYTRHFLD